MFTRWAAGKGISEGTAFTEAWRLKQTVVFRTCLEFLHLEESRPCGWFSRAKILVLVQDLLLQSQDPLRLELFHKLLPCFWLTQISFRSPFLLWVSSLLRTLLPGMSEAHTSSSWQAMLAPYKTVVMMFAFAFITYLLVYCKISHKPLFLL